MTSDMKNDPSKALQNTNINPIKAEIKNNPISKKIFVGWSKPA
ncbi:hypothetical protein [Planktothricoides raciborskii]|nr:hypothetical protein [Planktothricoides raciborskii]